MRENRNNQDRPEQTQMAREIGREFPDFDVATEDMISYDKENGERTCAIVDISIPELGVVYRLNGQIHSSNRMETHDWEQKIYLEQLGFFVIDVDTS